MGLKVNAEFVHPKHALCFMLSRDVYYTVLESSQIELEPPPTRLHGVACCTTSTSQFDTWLNFYVGV